MIPEQDARQAIMLAGQGANVSGIARRLGHDRKTIRIYLNGHRAPGQPRPHADSFAPFAAYVRQRAYDDRHLRAAGLHREITALGYAGSYSAFTRELRGHGITAACGTCRSWKPITPAQAPRRYPVPLPFRTAPVAGETIASYLTRAAAASHLPAGVITACLPSWFAARAAACDDLAATGQPQPADIRHLAALTGTSETALRHALPALGTRADRPPVRAVPACRRCASRARQREPVPVHIPAHQRACARHRTWLGRAIQIDLAAAPDIISACRHAARLPGSTASPGSCSPRRPPASRRPPRPAARTPGSAPWRSRHRTPAWTPGTRTWPKQRPTPRRSNWPPRSSTALANYPPGRNNWQNPAPGTPGPTSMTRRQSSPCHLKRPAQVRGTLPGRYICHRTVQGESGIGKTRLVLEALRDASVSPLVAYVADERTVGGELLAHLISEGRAAILVVDECPAERHVKLMERLPADPAIGLITIGDEGAAATRAPVVGVDGVHPETTDEFLRLNYPQLRPEARRFVADHSHGNMRWTIVLADRVAHFGGTQAADLIARNDIDQFVTTLLPEGRDFFCAAVLAMLERVGWDRELRYQMELLANFAGASVEEMESAATQLEQRGLLIRQGRYRSVTPHPLAVYLAAEGWRAHGGRLVTELLPQLDERMALALFRRAADLGRFDPARSALPQLLSPDGPFSSLEQLESRGLGSMLTQLAIVLPDEVALHLSELIEAASLETLNEQRSSRRDLVWTLEKLVWNTRTFETAADSLLRLALAENETYSNSATGTWLDLFLTMLPGTAATPEMRAPSAGSEYPGSS